MLITLVPNPNFFLSAQMMSDEDLCQSATSAALGILELRRGRAISNYTKMWIGFESGLLSYFITLKSEMDSRALQEVDNINGLYDYINSLGLEPNCENVPGWVADTRINENHQAYMKDFRNVALIYPF